MLGSKALIEGDVHTLLRQTGPSLSPFNAWLLLKSLETMPLRVRQMTESAAKIAAFLDGHPKVARVAYPFLKSHPQYDLAKRQMANGSTLMAIEVKGGREAAFKLSDSLSVILISNNLGDAKSLITHPGTTTHQRFTEEVRLESGITPGLLRLSVGLENVDDLITDLRRSGWTRSSSHRPGTPPPVSSRAGCIRCSRAGTARAACAPSNNRSATRAVPTHGDNRPGLSAHSRPQHQSPMPTHQASMAAL